MFTRQRWTQVSLTTLALVALSACGAVPAAVDTNNNDNPNPNPWPTWSPSPSPSPSESPDPLDPEDTLPPITYSFDVNGVNGSKTNFTASVNTGVDNTLKVKIRALDAGPITLSNGSSNPFTASYGCVKYTVTVNGRSVDTPILRVAGANNGLCSSAPTTYTMDFSDRLVAGASTATVKVSNPRYDFYCQYYSAMAGCQLYVGYYNPSCVALVASFYPGQCTVRSVYQTHTVRGQLEIYTNQQ